MPYWHSADLAAAAGRKVRPLSCDLGNLTVIQSEQDSPLLTTTITDVTT